MNKILLTDIFGTLVDSPTAESAELFHSCDMLEEWLSYNNYLCVITGSSHTSPKGIYEILSKIKYSINKKYWENILYFVTSDMYQYNGNRQYDRIKIQKFQNAASNFSFKQFTFREKCFLTALNIFGKEKEIYTIGDGFDDMCLATRVIKQGGYSGTIVSKEKGYDIYSVDEKELLLRAAIVMYWQDCPQNNEYFLLKSNEFDLNEDIINYYKIIKQKKEQGLIDIDDLRALAYICTYGLAKRAPAIIDAAQKNSPENMRHYELYSDFESFFVKALRR
jgi:hypothetical protein